MERISVVKVLSLLVDELKIKVTKKSIETGVLIHPESYGLLAISELLDTWNVPNVSYNLTLDELISSNITTPFIAYVQNFNKSEFVLVHHFGNDQVVISGHQWDKQKFSMAEFGKMYREYILAAEKEDFSGEKNYKIRHRKELMERLRIPFLIASIAILTISFLLLHATFLTSLPILSLVFLKTVGLVTAILLLLQSVDAANPLIQRICGTDSKRNCGAILSSKASKITNNLNWSEVGFFYFSGTFLSLLFDSNRPAVLHVLAVLNICALPYTFYSIYYQWRIARQWCLFCCTIQALLWLEFFSFLPILSFSALGLSLIEFYHLVSCAAIPVLGWIFVKPYLLSHKQVKLLNNDLADFKYTLPVFQELLYAGTKQNLLSEEDSIMLGNKNADITLTLVSNLNCETCGTAHKTINEWMSKRNDINLQIVFPIYKLDTDRRTPLATHLMALRSADDDSVISKALHDWYGGVYKTYESWAKHYPVSQQKNENDSLKKQGIWCKQVGITGSPVIFINGYRLPFAYNIKDVEYMI